MYVNRFATGLCPDPLGDLTVSPDPPAAGTKGIGSPGRGEEQGRDRRREGEQGREKEGRREERRGMVKKKETGDRDGEGRKVDKEGKEVSGPHRVPGPMPRAR